MNTSNIDYNTFEELCANNYRHVLSFVMSRVHNLQDAEDITQETFSRAYKAAYTPMEGKKPITWLCTIAYHIVVDRARHNKKSAAPIFISDLSTIAETDIAYAPDIDQSIYQRQEIQRVLKLMPDQYQRALILRAYYGYSFQKCASIENTTPATMKARYWRAIASFRKMYKSGEELAS